MELEYFYPLIGVLASLLLTYVSFRYFLYYNGLLYASEEDQDKNRRLLRQTQVILLVSSLAFIVSLVNLFIQSRNVIPPPAATVTQGEGANFPSPTSSTSSALVPSLSPVGSPTPEVVPSSGFARVGNTNGFGVFVRSEPGLEYEALTQLSDGSRVELTSEVQPADGFNWQRVRLEDGRLGWIADNFLIPEP